METNLSDFGWDISYMNMHGSTYIKADDHMFVALQLMVEAFLKEYDTESN